jgi:hypothetical protein
MEMFVIAIVAVIAFAAVLYPLMKRRDGAADDHDEFDGPAAPAPPATRAPKPVRAEKRAPRRVEPPADVARPEVDVEAGEGVVPPMAAGPATPVAPVGLTPEQAPEQASEQAPEKTPRPRSASPGGSGLEDEVARYRAALRAGTICRKCGEANPPESRFCADCGGPLPLTESKEFD